ncbi:mitochondrial carrier protein [Nitzschia inconspicua]|uniref:Mitochondrial carrier protein n=1 Tax=Nitzschia inconspicua TaxID=303405 RepID=A0A9K3LQI8_9STRA|nr:mitochondrial carrier protein [Nitzschia inconspicua]
MPPTSNTAVELPSTAGQYNGSGWAKIMSASVGSTITALAVTPLEVVKVRQQAAGRGTPPAVTVTAQNNVSAAVGEGTAAVSSKKPLPKNVTPCPRGCGTFVLNTGLGEYLTPRNRCRFFDPVTGSLRQDQEITQSRGTLRMLRSIFVKEGLGGIYAGLAPTLVMGIPNTIIYFYSYEELATKLRYHYPTEPMVPAVAGASARFMASLCTAPFELLRTRQAARVGSASSSADVSAGMVSEFRSMIRSDGVTSLFRGLYPTLMRDVPFSAVYWLCIESMRDFWKRRRNQDSKVSSLQQGGEALINGSVSGTIAAAVTTPLDVLKTRSQVEFTQTKNPVREMAVESSTAVCDHGGALAYHPSKTTSTSAASSESMLQMTRTILEEEGVAGLWRGNVARMMKVAPACAIMISSYEIGKRLLLDQQEQ